jgi:predicted acyltransferase
MTQPLSKRLLSLDVFRGITVAAMALVNNPGDWGHIYPPLEHSAWNGCTPTDLIFPFFLFMVGVSVVYAMESKKASGANQTSIILVALRRMAILIAISLVTQMIFHPGLATLRLPGVLQRIAIVFFICVVLYLKTSQKTRDRLFAICLISYYIIMCFIPVPGHGPANLEPETNIGAWIDRTVFTENHLWSQSRTWDPEGLLGTLPAIATGLFGMRVGSWLKRKDRDDAVKVFPVNKALWTSSFVLYTGGLGTITLAICYWLIDVHGHKRFVSFFIPFGVNAITAYVLSMYVPHYLNKITFNTAEGPKGIYKLVFEPYFSPVNASLASAVALVLLLWLIMWVLYKNKIIIKV